MASFCMAVSTFVVMLIFIASNAAQELLTSYFYSNSPQLFSITCKIEGDKKYQLTEDEIEALVQKYNNIENAYYYVSSSDPCTICGSETSLLLSGISRMPDNTEICEGQGLFHADKICEQSIVLSEETAKELYIFPSSAVGKIITISSTGGITKEFRIAGIYRNHSETNNNRALIRFTSYKNLFDINENLRFGYVEFRLSDINYSEDLAISIKKSLISRCNENTDYKVRIMNLDLTKNIKSIIRIITFVLFVASIIIILVSGIGIRNVIISIMQSYTHIIGIERAIGASEKTIIAEYMLRGSVIAFIGTFLGCSSALLLITAANTNITAILEYLSELFRLDYLPNVPFRFSITATETMITIAVSIIIVILCCYDPVQKTASMKVVDSMYQ